MLRCVLRSTLLWKSDQIKRIPVAVYYKLSSFAVSPHLGSNKTKGRILKNVRYYFQNPQDAVKEHTTSTEPTGIHKKAAKSPLVSHLENCFSPTDVLDVLELYPVTSSHISNVFTRMWDCTKKMNVEQQRVELRLMFEHPVFRDVCERVVTDAWQMKCDDLAYTLLAFVHLGISQNSKVVQTLLRVIQERLNQFDARALSVLAAGIQHMENSSNVQALREALRLLLKDCIPEIKSVTTLHNMMRAVGKNSPKELKMQLAIKTLSLADGFTPSNNQYVFFSLAAMDLSFKPLLNICSKNIAENVHESPFTRLVMVLKSCHELKYRNFMLFNSISEHVANTFDMWTNKKVIIILTAFDDLVFRPVQLLDAFAERIIQDPENLTLKDLLCVLKVFSKLNHDLKERKAEFLESLTRVIDSYLPKMTPFELLKVVYCLSLMQHFPPEPLAKLLHPGTLEQLLQKETTSNKVKRWLFTLDLCLKLDKPPLPPSVTSFPLLNISPPVFEPLLNQEMLKVVKSIVGKDAVREAVIEQGFYFIDWVITLPAQEHETENLNAEDSASSECIQRIALISAQPNTFCYGTAHYLGVLGTKLRHLEKLGYKPVLVPINELNSKTEEEKIMTLQKLIFSTPSLSGADKVVKDRPKN